MKKFLVFLVACVALVACNNRGNEPQEPIKFEKGQVVTIKAGMPNDVPVQGPSRKITGTDSGTQIDYKWETGDKILVKVGEESAEFTLSKGAGTANAEFTGTMPASGSTFSIQYPTTTPDLSTQTYSNKVAIPTGMMLFTGTGALIGDTTWASVNLTPQYAILQLNLYGTDIIVGSMNVTCGSNTYTLSCGDGVTLGNSESSATPLYLVVQPDTNTISVSVKDKQKKPVEMSSFQTSNSNYLTKGGCLYMPAKEVKGVLKLWYYDNSTKTEYTSTSALSFPDSLNKTLKLWAEYSPGHNTTVLWTKSEDTCLVFLSDVTKDTVIVQRKLKNLAGSEGPFTSNITCKVKGRDTSTVNFSYCLAAGTRIMMADGSIKLVENIVEGDLIRTFDHEAGCISSAKVCLTYKGESKAASLDLTFASGKKLSIVGTHDLLLENTRKYVRINSGNVASYVGKRFYNAETGKWDALVSYKMGTPVDYYCIYSAKHLNCIAGGLLTCPDDVDFILNIYNLDKNLKADAAQLAADKAQYGLFDVAKDFPEFAEYKDQMEDLGCQYVYIAIGKGLVPTNYIETMKAYWRGE